MVVEGLDPWENYEKYVMGKWLPINFVLGHLETLTEKTPMDQHSMHQVYQAKLKMRCLI